MEYGYADNTTYAARNIVMHKTQISRAHGIRLCRKHSLGNTWDGFIMLLWNFKAHVLSPVKTRKPFL